MPVSSHWDDPRQSILRTVYRSWTWQELLDHEARRLPQMLQTRRHPVALILEMHAAAPDNAPVYWLNALSLPGHINVDMVVFVTDYAGGSLRLGDAHRRYSRTGTRYTIASGLSEARRMIQAYRQTSPAYSERLNDGYGLLTSSLIAVRLTG